jgi:hypothetical protein
MLSSTSFPIILIGAIVLTIVLLFLFRKVTLKAGCPVCGNRHPDRVHRANWLRAIEPILPLKAYHCLSCRHRFYQLSRDSSTTKAA